MSLKFLNKNILINEPLDGIINFSSNKKLSKDELFNILEISLKEKGYVLKDEKNFYKLTKLNEIEQNPLFTKMSPLHNHLILILQFLGCNFLIIFLIFI